MIDKKTTDKLICIGNELLQALGGKSFADVMACLGALTLGLVDDIAKQLNIDSRVALTDFVESMRGAVEQEFSK